MSARCLQVSVSAPSRELADHLVRTAVEARLAACAQVSGPVQSTFRWQGRVEQAAEWLCLFKTTRARYAELERHVRALHRYENPEVIAVEVAAGSEAYLEWIAAETTPTA